jgi:hypothetical protein
MIDIESPIICAIVNKYKNRLGFIKKLAGIPGNRQELVQQDYSDWDELKFVIKIVNVTPASRCDDFFAIPAFVF